MCRLAAYIGKAIKMAAVVFGGPHALLHQVWHHNPYTAGRDMAIWVWAAWFDVRR
jgi:hypothetical protein